MKGGKEEHAFMRPHVSPELLICQETFSAFGDYTAERLGSRKAMMGCDMSA